VNAINTTHAHISQQHMSISPVNTCLYYHQRMLISPTNPCPYRHLSTHARIVRPSTHSCIGHQHKP